jgi:hypothetical protein
VTKRSQGFAGFPYREQEQNARDRQITEWHGMQDDGFAPMPKLSRRYLFWRLYAVVGILMFWAACIGAMYSMLVGAPTNIFVEVGSLVVGAPAILLIMDWFAFPWSYSVFGRYLRHSKPALQPESVLCGSWAEIGSLSTPMVTWSFFKDGVGIDAVLTGNAYLPADYIARIEKRWMGRYAVHHTFAELRSPIVMSRAACLLLFSSLEDEHRQRIVSA